jgi:TPR repeat protein
VNLGNLHERGESGFAVDKKLALSLYAKGCSLGSSVGCKNVELTRHAVKRDATAFEFRRQLAVGNDSHCGLIVEVKGPIAKVQTMIGEMWLKVDQLFPQGQESCRFRNGVYQDPG